MVSLIAISALSHIQQKRAVLNVDTLIVLVRNMNLLECSLFLKLCYPGRQPPAYQIPLVPHVYVSRQGWKHGVESVETEYAFPNPHSSDHCFILYPSTLNYSSWDKMY